MASRSPRPYSTGQLLLLLCPTRLSDVDRASQSHLEPMAMAAGADALFEVAG